MSLLPFLNIVENVCGLGKPQVLEHAPETCNTFGKDKHAERNEQCESVKIQRPDIIDPAVLCCNEKDREKG